MPVHNIRLDQTAGISMFNVKGRESPVQDQAAAQAGCYKCWDRALFFDLILCGNQGNIL